MSALPKKYLAYLLRLWQAQQNGNVIWRASLEDTRTSEKRGFASLEVLMDFLKEQIKGDEKDNPVKPTSERPDKPS